MSKKFWVIFSVAFLVSCGGGGGGGGSSEPTPPPTPAASVNLSADPLSVLVGNQTTLTWSTSYASSCSASGSWSGSKPTAGTEDVDIETIGDNQFTLTCSGSGGSGSGGSGSGGSGSGGSGSGGNPINNWEPPLSDADYDELVVPPPASSCSTVT